MRKIKLLGLLLIIASIGLPTILLLKMTVDEQLEVIYLSNLIQNKEEYFAILEIPKIHLKKELYPSDHKKNNVEENILVHEKSVFPGSNISNIILASHSGNGIHAYFKNLYLLDRGDELLLYYQNQIYQYEIINIEEQTKTGSLSLIKENEDMITLITCTYQNQNTQTIYYAILKNIQNIP